MTTVAGLMLASVAHQLGEDVDVYIVLRSPGDVHPRLKILPNVDAFSLDFHLLRNHGVDDFDDTRPIREAYSSTASVVPITSRTAGTFNDMYPVNLILSTSSGQTTNAEIVKGLQTLDRNFLKNG